MIRYLRFRLKSLFVVVFIFAGILTFMTRARNQGQRQIDAVSLLESETQPMFQSTILFENAFDEEGGVISSWIRPAPPQTVWQNYMTGVASVAIKISREQSSGHKLQAILDAIKCFPNLSRFVLVCSDEFIPELFSIAISHDLRGLGLVNMKLTDEHVCQIAKLRNLNNLSLAQNNITGCNLGLICKMPKLRILDLSDNAVTDEYIFELSKSKSLRYVYLSGNPIQQSSIAALQEKCPQLDIVMR